jgi:hypothetical protein
MMPFSRRAFLASAVAVPSLSAARTQPLSQDDEDFLEDLSRRAFLYFWEQADPHTGLVLDRVRADTVRSKRQSLDVASTANTGFGLTAFCIAAERGWQNRGVIRERILATLRHLMFDQPHVRGWFYHFVNCKTGAREWKSELSTIDTALLLCGVLVAASYFADDPEIPRLARALYERVEFSWMYDPLTGLLRMGWYPEKGFLRAEWVDYREGTVLQLLAIGSAPHPIPVEAWYRFERDPAMFDHYRWIGRGPIFTHQYSHAWIDYRGLRDGPPFEINYFNNSIIATRAHRAFCLSLRGEFPSFSENLWGLSPSDSEIGYIIWGDVGTKRDVDGSVVPSAVAGSLMFTPDICLPALRFMREQFGDLIYGPYGFVDSFNPQTSWANPDYVGIDQGITLLSAENLRSGRVWNWFARDARVNWAMGQIFSPA